MYTEGDGDRDESVSEHEYVSGPQSTPTFKSKELSLLVEQPEGKLKKFVKASAWAIGTTTATGGGVYFVTSVLNSFNYAHADAKMYGVSAAVITLFANAAYRVFKAKT